MTLSSSIVEAQTFKNCRSLWAKYPYGVAINFGVVGTSEAEINRTIYLRNQRLDRDKDGIVCEDEALQSLGVATTLPATRKTPVTDLAAFVQSFGSALSTIQCRGSRGTSTGSGTSVSVSFTFPETIENGIRSAIVTNHHVVSGCLRGDWLNRQVTVLSGANACVGYVWGWDVPKDLATVYTRCEIPKVASFTSATVPRPVIGDTAIIIGSSAGIPGTSTQGSIANVTDTEILTTAQAAPGSSGGALFNRNGQLLGIVQGGTGSLTVVIPITQFPGAVYASSVAVAWAPY